MSTRLTKEQLELFRADAEAAVEFAAAGDLDTCDRILEPWRKLGVIPPTGDTMAFALADDAAAEARHERRGYRRRQRRGGRS